MQWHANDGTADHWHLGDHPVSYTHLIKTGLAALKDPKPTAKETPYEPMPENVEEIVAQAKGAH